MKRKGLVTERDRKKRDRDAHRCAQQRETDRQRTEINTEVRGWVGVHERERKKGVFCWLLERE